MRILQYLIIIAISIGSLLFTYSFYQVTYADGCSATSNGDATQFLTDCSQVGNASKGAIEPAIGNATDSIKTLITTVAERVISFGALFAIGAIVWSGIQYNISYGDDEKIKKAKTTSIYALIGLFLLLVAFPMVNIVVEFVYGLASK
jgi:hypothetical protein